MSADTLDGFPEWLDQELARYGFLVGYRLRNDEEEAEMIRLREALKARGIVPGWPEYPRIDPETVDISMFRAKKST